MKTLETDRLILRDWKEIDVDDFYEYAKVEGVGEMAGWPHHPNREASRYILNLIIEQGDTYALELKENHKVIGSVGLHTREFPEQNQRELGYVLSKDYWGQGIMTEAARRVIKYAFEEMNLDVLWCGHIIFNDRSRRVIEKCGFKFYENRVIEFTALNRKFDGRIYKMTKCDFNENIR